MFWPFNRKKPTNPIPTSLIYKVWSKTTYERRGEAYTTISLSYSGNGNVRYVDVEMDTEAAKSIQTEQIVKLQIIPV